MSGRGQLASGGGQLVSGGGQLVSGGGQLVSGGWAVGQWWGQLVSGGGSWSVVGVGAAGQQKSKCAKDDSQSWWMAHGSSHRKKVMEKSVLARKSHTEIMSQHCFIQRLYTKYKDASDN